MSFEIFDPMKGFFVIPFDAAKWAADDEDVSYKLLAVWNGLAIKASSESKMSFTVAIGVVCMFVFRC